MSHTQQLMASWRQWGSQLAPAGADGAEPRAGLADQASGLFHFKLGDTPETAQACRRRNPYLSQ